MSLISEIKKSIETASLPVVGLKVHSSSGMTIYLRSDTGHMVSSIDLTNLFGNKSLDINIDYSDGNRLGGAFHRLTPSQYSKIEKQLLNKYWPETTH